MTMIQYAEGESPGFELEGGLGSNQGSGPSVCETPVPCLPSRYLGF